MGIGVRSLLLCWQTHNGNPSEENIRSSNNAVKTITSEHERIHAGKMYHYSNVSTLASGATTDILISVNSLNSMHVRAINYAIDVGPCEGYLYEAPFTDINSLGVPFNVVNLNRTNQLTAASSFYNNPFINANSLGTRLDSVAIVEATGGNIKSIAGVSESSVTEWNFKKGVDYVFRFTNKSGSTGLYSTNISFYEPHD